MVDPREEAMRLHNEASTSPKNVRRTRSQTYQVVPGSLREEARKKKAENLAKNMEVMRRYAAGQTVTTIAEEMGMKPNNVKQTVWNQMHKYKKDLDEVRMLWGYRLERMVEVAWPKAMSGEDVGMDQMIRIAGVVGRIYDLRTVPVEQMTNVFVLPGQQEAIGQLTVDELRALARSMQAPPVALPAPEVVDVGVLEDVTPGGEE